MNSYGAQQTMSTCHTKQTFTRHARQHTQYLMTQTQHDHQQLILVHHNNTINNYSVTYNKIIILCFRDHKDLTRTINDKIWRYSIRKQLEI